ncbi:glycoside hydrolase family 105 protein [Pleomassaria siparia CBS 279.74]|uniref:Glycoside hydrolase family 105 protein n=1 Tax=Pleomassaria siparia CBS 279.74 TaxID=1314801 RepID=A0A6G1JV57_9PLEO|nr:glycoside hydrolase family 105 protein [Pleomassaria siparia CBS 279.74]
MHLEAVLLALLTVTPTAFAAPNATLPYSTWLATSFLSKKPVNNNHYVSNVINEGIQKAATLHKNATLLSFVSNQISSLVAENGTIKGWNPKAYSLDDIRVGNNFLYFWDSEGRTNEKLKTAATALRQNLDRYPRNPSGGFWHRDPTYPNQMWLDGLYMASPFYATYTSYFEPTNTTAWNDIALQFDLIHAHTRNTTTNLLYHGYDESKTAVWADPDTGASPYVWNRALGWYIVALVEVLQVFPQSNPGYARLKEYLTTVADGVKKAQDTSGGWWLIMDPELAGAEGNYIESSATAMFTYAYLKGVRTGLLDKAYRDTASKAYSLMTDKFVKVETNGTLSWEGTVEVGSLKGDASYEYYVGVPLSENDGKGAGPFMFAATEMELWKAGA